MLFAMTTVIALGLFFYAPSFGIGPLYYRDPYRLHVATPSERLREEEMQYAVMLKAHEGLIRKHGPIREDIYFVSTRTAPILVDPPFEA